MNLTKKLRSLEEALTPHIIKCRVNADKAALAVLSDVHQGLNDRVYLQNAVKFLLSCGENCKVVLGGDSTNTTTRNSKGNVLEEWCSGDKQIETLVEDIRPLYESGQLIGITSGNHPQRAYNETFITIEMMMAALLGNRELYKGNIGLVYFNVNKNLYVHHIVHKHRKTEGYYDYFNADVVWLEHLHTPKAVPKIIIEHNKYAKKPIVKECWNLWQGSFQVYPEYSKAAGYKPTLPGFWITEMTGDEKNRMVTPYLDHAYSEMIKGGYKL